MSFFRYPGGKAKFAKHILPLIPFDEVETFVEPFFGGGAITIAGFKQQRMGNISTLLINDIDTPLMCLWSYVLDQTEKLIYEIEEFKPTVEAFYQFKQDLLNIPNFLYFTDAMKGYYGFRKLAVHQMSFSGLGVKAGGPIGGSAQTSDYGVDCRWSPKSMAKKIRQIRIYLDSIDDIAITTMSVFDIIRWIDKFKDAFIYLDPPYFVKGDELYQNSFSPDEHILLAQDLHETKAKWLLSYDDCPEIRELYSWAKIIEVDANYTIRTARSKSELLILNY